MVGRLKTAVAIIKNGVEELQRRYDTLEREKTEPGSLGAREVELHRRAVLAEAQVHSLCKDLEQEKAKQFADAEEQQARPPSPTLRMETEPERRWSEERRSPSPLAQRVTRAKARTLAKERNKGERMVREKTTTVSTSPMPLQREGQEEDLRPVTMGMLPDIIKMIVRETQKAAGSRLDLPDPLEQPREGEDCGGGKERRDTVAPKYQATKDGEEKTPPKKKRKKEKRGGRRAR